MWGPKAVDESQTLLIMVIRRRKTPSRTPAGSPFEIAIGVSGDSVVAQVIDHGPGLPPDAAAKVFERFYRNDYGRARTKGGAGLGLSIATALMAAHAGTITYADTQGGGSTFTMTFPRSTTSA